MGRNTHSSAEYRDRLVPIKTLVDDIGRPAEERLAAIGELVADMGLPSASSHDAWLIGNFQPTRVFVVAFLIDFTLRIFVNPRYAGNPDGILSRRRGAGARPGGRTVTT
jgi:hypothetical protein